MPPEQRWSACRACAGTGRVPRDRAYMSATGEVRTVIAEARCLHCRAHPGRQPGDGNAPPV